MKLEPIAQFLESKNVGTEGQNLFAYSMPENVKQGTLLLSSLSGTAIDYELPGYRRCSFQVIVRHTDHVGGYELAEQVMSVLSIKNTQLTGMSVKYIRPRHDPVVFPVSEGDFLEFSVNYDAVYVMA